MKKLALIALPLLLAACSNVNLNGVQPYSVQFNALSYDAPLPSSPDAVSGQVVSTPGAPDVNRLLYTATLIDGNGDLADTNDNSPIAPTKGVLLTGVKGGYYCYTTTGAPVPAPEATACWMGADNVKLVSAGANLWPQNGFEAKQLIPNEWMVAHYQAMMSNQGGTAPWQVEFVFTAEQANGSSVTWKQTYQFTSR
ncbi:hypothetical protein [Deinococcus fonticola]|uniref:hypothetical protein n=1 Tax=Deinococcus fonticola TaxID=2528713 RepID=UPI00107544A5|nr:hypothetical protein [Deinococcus fonticola]